MLERSVAASLIVSIVLFNKPMLEIANSDFFFSASIWAWRGARLASTKSDTSFLVSSVPTPNAVIRLVEGEVEVVLPVVAMTAYRMYSSSDNCDKRPNKDCEACSRVSCFFKSPKAVA